MCAVFFFFQAEDGIRDLVRSRGLGDVYKRQGRRPHRQRGDAGARLVQRRAGFDRQFCRARYVYMLSLIHI